MCISIFTFHVTLTFIHCRGTANVEAPLTMIEGEESRKMLADIIDTKLREATSIGAGLSRAMNDVRDFL